MSEKMVEIEIDIDDREFLYVAEEAHRRDITFNEMMNLIIEQAIADAEQQEKEHK